MKWNRETTPDRIKTILAAIDRRQVELAHILNVSPVTVNRWVNGRSSPDNQCREKLELLEHRFVGEDQ